LGMSSATTLKWTPWGGVGEIGMNCMVLEFADQAIPIDAGIMFADANDYGIGSIFADFEVLLQKYKPKDWLITHVHEDHIGAVPYIFLCADSLGLEPPLIHAPPLAAAMIREKIKEVLPHKFHSALDKIKTVEVGDSIKIGAVDVTFIGVSHSAPQSTALALEWRVAGRTEPIRIIHSGDFKEDTTAQSKGQIFDDKWKNYRPDLMFVDSTNANRSGHSVAESEIIEPLKDIVQNSAGRVFITLFSSNAERVAALTNVAESCRRRMALAGRSLQTMMRLSAEVGVFTADDYSPQALCEVSDLRNLEDVRQMIICSGSQGELRSVLSRMANGTHQDFQIKESDTIIFSSKIIPGNEKSIYRMINRLMAQGARVIWEEESTVSTFGPIHASGHGRRQEISSALVWLDPKVLVPVHGNVFQMREVEKLAVELKNRGSLSETKVFSAENGDVLEFGLDVSRLKDPTYSRWADYMPKYLRLENFVSPSLDPFLRVRKRAAMGGLVSVVIDQSGRFKARIEGVSPSTGPRKEMLERVQKLVDDFCQSAGRRLSKDWPFGAENAKAEQNLSEDLSRELRRLLGAKPAVIVHLVGL
jgi:ribonuclease J